MRTPEVFLAYVPGGGLRCALVYLKSGEDAYGWFSGPRGDGTVASCYFVLERFYANAPDCYAAVDDADLHSVWLLEEERRHELAAIQERFANEWLLNWQDPREVTVRAERLEKFSRLHTPWTYCSRGFERQVLTHLARHWPLSHRPGTEHASAEHKRRVATRARP